MSYRNYIIAAYSVFVVVLLWDFLAPRLQMRQLLRAARLRLQRQQAAPVQIRDEPHSL
ncbi:MAG: heme exporter protein CcmD [Luteimonas sp.]